MFTTLLSTSDLAPHVGQPGWVLFDCRHDLTDAGAGEKAYAQAHIPGAFFAHLDRHLAGTKTGSNGRHPLPDLDVFVEFLRTHGVDEQTQVIAYDASGGMFAARLWWLTRQIGHRAVAVLDGGLPAWTAAGLELTAVAPLAPAPGQIRRSDPLGSTVDASEILQHLGALEQVLVDARAPERYRGDVEPLDPVAGHIPGAVNRFYQHNLDASGRFKPADQLRAEFQALLGERSPSALIHQCGSGVTACHNLLAMEIAGLPGTRLYPGSWSEWCADPARPVERTTGAL